jgi:3,5-dihydroxyphenylacetyl-CoA synthase
MDPSAHVVGVGTATPPTTYSQDDVLRWFNVRDPRTRSIFANSHISRRALYLPCRGPDGEPAIETQGELLAKHRSGGLQIGSAAVRACLRQAGVTAADVQYLCCVTSTGWLTPGFSALLVRELGMRVDCGRLDVVGMGCNAGLNALGAVATWARCNPGKLAVVLCVEVCSAAYVFDGSLPNVVVNSLFGDGAAAVAVQSGDGLAPQRPAIVEFASCLIPEAIQAMRYDWDDKVGKFSFYLDRDVPYVVGAYAEQAVDALLEQAGRCRRDITHWVIHSGGKKVIDAVKINLGLTSYDVRHTMSVLRDYGNLSSGSFLFSYERLLDEGCVGPRDQAVLMTMGPGSTIETALLQW